MTYDQETSHYDAAVLIVNYEADVQDVYSSVVKAIVDATGTLGILGLCSKTSNSFNRTWTPDWTIRGQPGYINDSPLGPDEGVTIFRASLDRLCKAVFSTDLATMTVSGIFWDVIDYHKHTRYYVNHFPNSIVPEAFQHTCMRVWKHIEKANQYNTSENGKHALIRILLSTPTNTSDKRWSKEEQNDRFDLIMGKRFSAIEDWPRNKESTIWKDRSLLKSIDDVVPYHRTLVVTNRGWVGQAACPNLVENGDVVYVLLGCPVPMVLRPVEDHYEVISDIYVDGIMFGEAIEALERGEVKLQDFELH